MEKSKGSVILRIIIAVFAAVAIWLYVDIGQATTIRTTVRNIPVEFSGEDTVLADRNLMLVSGYDATIDLWLEGPRSTLWKLDKNKIRIVADTSGISYTGVQTLSYNVIYPDNVSRNNIKVEKASAYSITVTVGELSQKEIPVYCDVVGEVADGFHTETVQLDPAMLVLRGQRDDLLDISYAKIELDADGADRAIVKGLAYTLYDYNDIALERDSIRTDTKLIQATLPVKTTKNVPLVIHFEEAPGSTMDQMTCTLAPFDTLTLTGDKDALADIDSIVLDTIYLQDLAAYQSIDYVLTAPEGTRLPEGATKVTATIVVNNVIERSLMVADFAFVDVPEGFTATAVTESLDILVRGLTEEVEALTPEDIVVTASLADITAAGNYTVPVEVKMPDFPHVGPKGNYQLIVHLSVTVEEPEPENGPVEPDTPGEG